MIGPVPEEVSDRATEKVVDGSESGGEDHRNFKVITTPHDDCRTYIHAFLLYWSFSPIKG